MLLRIICLLQTSIGYERGEDDDNALLITPCEINNVIFNIVYHPHHELITTQVTESNTKHSMFEHFLYFSYLAR